MSAELSVLHDAELWGIQIHRHRKELELEFAREDGALHRLIFRGVASFRMVDVIPQNVVSRVLLSAAGAMPRGDLARWVAWIGTLSDGANFATDVERVVAGIEAGRLQLLVVEPSFGSEMAVLYASLEQVVHDRP